MNSETFSRATYTTVDHHTTHAKQASLRRLACGDFSRRKEKHNVLVERLERKADAGCYASDH